jgi:hypothetical protein
MGITMMCQCEVWIVVEKKRVPSNSLAYFAHRNGLHGLKFLRIAREDNEDSSPRRYRYAASADLFGLPIVYISVTATVTTDLLRLS